MNYKENLKILFEKVVGFSFRDSEEFKQKQLAEAKQFIDKINSFAMKKIDWNRCDNKQWLVERISEQQDNELWRNLSRDTTSSKYFHADSMDPTEGIFYVDTNFLIRKKGNTTGSLGKEDKILDAFKKGVKLPTPQYWLRDNNLGEGNHRVMVAEKFKLKSVPVRVYWK